MFLKKHDKKLAILIALLTLLFFTFAITNREFLDWVFARHQNQLSWYIRPLFLIPFCFFAFKKSWAGISITVFCIFTSMFWFPQPHFVTKQVEQFLLYEINYLTGEWNIFKILLTLLVPLSLILLAFGFWKKNIFLGLSVIILIALGKILWSIMSAGESGKSIIGPAIVGLLFCVGIIYWGYNKLLNKKKSNNRLL
jgi:hypothetical protein